MIKTVDNKIKKVLCLEIAKKSVNKNILAY